jgi:hypothetical protein
MSSSTVRCYALGGDVSVVSDLNGKVTNVICPHFVRLNNMCQLKVLQTEGIGNTVLASLSDRLAGTRTLFCEFTEPGSIFKKS